MTKLIIGTPDEAEREPEIRFWLDCRDTGHMWLRANAGGDVQNLVTIAPDGRVKLCEIHCRHLMKFFGSSTPFKGLE